jgi:hypothetical protein
MTVGSTGTNPPMFVSARSGLAPGTTSGPGVKVTDNNERRSRLSHTGAAGAHRRFAAGFMQFSPFAQFRRGQTSVGR